MGQPLSRIAFHQVPVEEVNEYGRRVREREIDSESERLLLFVNFNTQSELNNNWYSVHRLSTFSRNRKKLVTEVEQQLWPD